MPVALARECLGCTQVWPPLPSTRSRGKGSDGKMSSYTCVRETWGCCPSSWTASSQLNVVEWHHFHLSSKGGIKNQRCYVFYWNAWCVNVGNLTWHFSPFRHISKQSKIKCPNGSGHLLDILLCWFTPTMPPPAPPPPEEKCVHLSHWFLCALVGQQAENEHDWKWVTVFFLSVFLVTKSSSSFHRKVV